MIAGAFRLNKKSSRSCRIRSDVSEEDEVQVQTRQEGLECPICWEHFNIVENVPYVLWCGHTLCKNCVLGLRAAIIRFFGVRLGLPHFVSCPWCNCLSFRLVYKGKLQFPRKNFFLLWMVESVNGNRSMLKSHSSICGDNALASYLTNASGTLNHRPVPPNQPQRLEFRGHFFRGYFVSHNFPTSLHKCFALFARLTAKLLLVVIFVLIVIYAVPVTGAILVVYAIITVLFAFPSLLVIYFAYPSLDWLIKEIIN